MNTNSVTFFNENKLDSLSDETSLIMAAWEISNPGNMGYIIRLAHNFGVEKDLFVNENKEFKTSRIKKTAGFSFEQMDWNFISPPDFYTLINDGSELVVLETCDGAKNIFQTNLPKKAIILAGSESHGLPLEVIEKSRRKVFIPMPGGCKSMNVSHALAIEGFEWYRQTLTNSIDHHK